MLSLFHIIIRLLLFYVTLSLLLGFIPYNTHFNQDPHGIVIYVASNGVHTDIVLPVKFGSVDWNEFFKETTLNPVMKYSQYIAFGWGSREFYITTPEWKDLTPWIAIKALFLKGEPALHVSLFDFTPVEGESVKQVCLSGKQFENLTTIIRSAFIVDKNGRPIAINAPGYYDNDLFFEASGRFNIFRTCNVWTNECLKSTGIRCGVWTPLDFQVLYQLSQTRK